MKTVPAVLCALLLVSGLAVPVTAATPGAGTSPVVDDAPTAAGGPAVADPVESLASLLAPGKVSVSPTAPLDLVPSTLAPVERLLSNAGDVDPGSLLEQFPWRTVPLLAGYTRHGDADPLAHDTRTALYEAVVADPGVHLTGASEAAEVPRSTARYHVRVLEDAGLVDAVAVDGRNRLFPADGDAADGDRALAAALQRDGTAPVLRALADRPATVTALADRLDRAPSTVSYHLSRLAEDDLVRKVRDGGATRVSLSGAARAALGDGVEGENESDAAAPDASALPEVSASAGGD